MHTIIAATDFSKAASNATKFAAAIAAELQAKLLLVHALELPFNPNPLPFSTEEFEEISQSAIEQMDKLKSQLLFYTDNKIEVVTELAFGLPEAVLNGFCEKVKPFAIVLGLGNDVSTSHFIGSTVLRLLPQMKCPLLIIPENSVFCGIRNIAIASDSEHVREKGALQSIKAWLKAFQASPLVLHVGSESEDGFEKASGDIFLYNHLKEFNPLFYSVNNKNIEEGILGLLKEKKPDFLIVIPGKYHFFKALFHESHSKKLILQSHLPVLALPSDLPYQASEEPPMDSSKAFQEGDRGAGLNVAKKETPEMN